MSINDDSFIVRKLTLKETKKIKKELASNDHLWAPHCNRKWLTALKDGKSIHLKYDAITNVDTDHWNKFPYITSIITEIAGNKPIMRTYWHRLLPEDCIEEHNDSAVPYVTTNEIFARYQIYLDIPKESYILIDGVVQQDTQVFANSIVNFNLRKQHAYRNNSKKPWYFFVFDVMKSVS